MAAPERPRILALGDNVVDCYSDENVMYPGGNALNHAVFARRFGAETAYAGAVSDDAAGRAIRRSLIDLGVDVSLLRILPGRTAFCVISNQQGERVFLGANLGVSIIAPSAEDLSRMAAVDAVHTGRSSHLDAWLPRIAQLTRLSYDFATAHEADRIARTARHCYLASFSGGDLSPDQARALARQARSAGAQHVLVTRGEQGALLLGPDGEAVQPAATVQPVDTLGAGDTFIARTLVGLLRDEKPARLLAAAAEAAARTCLSRGAFGYGAPLDVDLGQAVSIDDIYRTTRSAPGPAKAGGA